MAANQCFLSRSSLPYEPARCAAFHDSDSAYISTCDSLPRMMGLQVGVAATSDHFHHNRGIQTWDSLPSTNEEDPPLVGREQLICARDELEEADAQSEAHRFELIEGLWWAGSPSASALRARGGLARALGQHAPPAAPAERSQHELLAFSSSVRRVRFLSSEGLPEAERFVHEGMLNKLPYFEAMLTRWDCGDAGDVRLPEGCSAPAVDALLTRLYSSQAPWTPADWGRALGPGLPAACAALSLAKFLLADDMAQELAPVLRQRTPDRHSRAHLAQSGATRDFPELHEELDEDANALVDAVGPEAVMAGIASVLAQPVDERTLMARLVLKELLDQKFGWD